MMNQRGCNPQIHLVHLCVKHLLIRQKYSCKYKVVDNLIYRKIQDHSALILALLVTELVIPAILIRANNKGGYVGT